MTGLPLPWVEPVGRSDERLTVSRRVVGREGDPWSTSTAALVEQAAAVGVAALRLSLVVQMVPALATGIAVSPRPHEYVTLWAVAVGCAVLGALVSVVRRRPPDAGLVAADVAVAALLLVLAGGTIPVEHRIGSWVGWTAGYALTVACTSGTLRSTRGWAACVGLLVVGYVFYVGPLVVGPTLPTVVANSLGYVVLATTVRLIVWYLRRVSGVADAARAEVARLARLEEEHRAQLAMHDATTVMQLLADPALPVELRLLLQTQAATEVNRMRSYLRGGGDTAIVLERSDLATSVARVCAGFTDLAPQLRTGLLAGASVDDATGDAVVAALRTVLHNVRRHAGASSVVVHGDLVRDRSDGRPRWTISVTDDGRGFDLRTTPLGVGLRTQVVDELARHGVETRIESRTGSGTRVELSGKARA